MQYIDVVNIFCLWLGTRLISFLLIGNLKRISNKRCNGSAMNTIMQAPRQGACITQNAIRAHFL